MYPCRNHPHVAGQRFCAQCRHPYCDGCLVDFLGQPHCGYCRDTRVRSMEGSGQYSHHRNKLRENLLLAAAIQACVVGFLLFQLGLLIPAGVFGGTLALTLIAALIAHVNGPK